MYLGPLAVKPRDGFEGDSRVSSGSHGTMNRNGDVTWLGGLVYVNDELQAATHSFDPV